MRELFEKAPVLILDEATSALDSETEKDIQKALESLINQKDKTVLAVAHRLSTLKNMDRIVVLDEGRIVEEGTHSQLMQKQNSRYHHLWQLQAL